MVLEQLAAAEASLTEDDKEFGAALVDVGAETTAWLSISAEQCSTPLFFPSEDLILPTTSPSVFALQFPKQRRSNARLAVPVARR